jgi:hypothetical protein
MTYILDQDYNGAIKYLLGEIEKDSSNLDAFYMILNVYTTELLDYESYILNGSRVCAYADTVLDYINRHIERKDLKQEAYKKYLFFKGNIFMHKGLIQAKTGSWIQGVKNARISVRLLKELLLLDSNCYDAILPVGLFNYYIGQNLKWIPFMNLKAKTALSDIEKSATVESPFSYGAKKSLLEIYIEKKQYKKADSLVSDILIKYPDNTIFLGIKAKISLLTKEFSKAILLGKKLKSLSENRTPVNWTDLTAAYYIVIASQYAIKNFSTCILSIESVNDLEIPRSAHEIIYVEKHLEKINNLKHKIQRK